MLMMKMFLIRIEFVWALVLAWCIVTSASAMDDIATKPGATGKPNEAVELVLKSNTYAFPSWSTSGPETPIPVSPSNDTSSVDVTLRVRLQALREAQPRLRVAIRLLNADGKLKINTVRWKDGPEDKEVDGDRVEISVAEQTAKGASTNLNGKIELKIIDGFSQTELIDSLIRGEKSIASVLQVSLFSGDANVGEASIKIVPTSRSKSDGNPVRGAAIAGMLVNGLAKDGPNDWVYMKPPLDGSIVGICLVPRDVLSEILDRATFPDSIPGKKQILGMLDRSIGIDGQWGSHFHYPGIYYDCSQKTYLLAFKDNAGDKSRQRYQQRRNKLTARAATRDPVIQSRLRAVNLGYLLVKPEYGVDLPGLRFTGINVGGEVAVFAAVGCKHTATVFNTSPFPREYIQQGLTDDQGKEMVPSLVDNIDSADTYIDSYKLSTKNLDIDSANPLPLFE